HKLLILGVHGYLVRGFAKVGIPEGHSAVGNHQAGDEAAHAVPDQDYLLVIWKSLVYPVQFFAQKFGRIRKKITARIAENPELIMFVNFRIASQLRPAIETVSDATGSFMISWACAPSNSKTAVRL